MLKRKPRTQQVLDELAQLSNAQLAQLLPAVFALRAQRGQHVLPRREAELLEGINRPLSAELQAEFDRLTEQRRKGDLSPAEARRLQRLAEKAELHDAHRLGCLVELAGRRGTTLDNLMRSLGLKTPAYA
jgi:hypothetical protein